MGAKRPRSAMEDWGASMHPTTTRDGDPDTLLFLETLLLHAAAALGEHNTTPGPLEASTSTELQCSGSEGGSLPRSTQPSDGVCPLPQPPSSYSNTRMQVAATGGSSQVAGSVLEAAKRQLRCQSKASVADATGNQWLKYGERLLPTARVLRAYFKCKFAKSHQCPALKTIEVDLGNVTSCAAKYSCAHNHDPPSYSATHSSERASIRGASMTAPEGQPLSPVDSPSGERIELSSSLGPCDSLPWYCLDPELTAETAAKAEDGHAFPCLVMSNSCNSSPVNNPMNTHAALHKERSVEDQQCQGVAVVDFPSLNGKPQQARYPSLDKAAGQVSGAKLEDHLLSCEDNLCTENGSFGGGATPEDWSKRHRTTYSMAPSWRDTCLEFELASLAGLSCDEIPPLKILEDDMGLLYVG